MQQPVRKDPTRWIALPRTNPESAASVMPLCALLPGSWVKAMCTISHMAFTPPRNRPKKQPRAIYPGSIFPNPVEASDVTSPNPPAQTEPGHALAPFSPSDTVVGPDKQSMACGAVSTGSFTDSRRPPDSTPDPILPSSLGGDRPGVCGPPPAAGLLVCKK